MADVLAKEMAKLAYQALEDKKAEDIKIIDINEVSVLADYFIIASGTNRNQVQALADNVEETLGRAGYQPKQTEGYRTANWILLDYGDLIVHVFDSENRLFYDLERIWRDGKDISAEEL
ncbi:MAG TPA: ribosome silencing factor [Candidatus Choladousia intestinavium]|uniref:Ribosomal silencing factor RsfS n=1 Tax=Candidatus Choladousia intestinavium TaxID=2840727 RepID=A0A9D1DAR6_9FIRM|nr:ribosome silencing factor [Candidatus Choladousia intestinavium]